MLEHFKNKYNVCNSGHSFFVKLNINFSLFSFDTHDSGHYIFLVKPDAICDTKWVLVKYHRKNEKQTEFVFMICQLTPLEQGVPKIIALKAGV
jgi:hypothetical protein